MTRPDSKDFDFAIRRPGRWTFLRSNTLLWVPCYVTFTSIIYSRAQISDKTINYGQKVAAVSRRRKRCYYLSIHQATQANSASYPQRNGKWVPAVKGAITSVFHQTTLANSASYSQRNGKWVAAKMRRCSVAGVKGRYGSFNLWVNVWVAGKTVTHR